MATDTAAAATPFPTVLAVHTTTRHMGLVRAGPVMHRDTDNGPPHAGRGSERSVTDGNCERV